jgi:hypothetical protein
VLLLKLDAIDILSLLIILLQVWSVARKYAFNPPKVRFRQIKLPTIATHKTKKMVSFHYFLPNNNIATGMVRGTQIRFQSTKSTLSPNKITHHCHP